MDFLQDWPYPLAVGVLFVIVVLRAGATYAVGRAAGAGAQRTGLRRAFDSAGFGRARRLVTRWGAPVVTASFLTVGIQTLVNAAAGMARMPLRRYLPALAVGGLVWALLYGTVGFVTFAAWRRLWEVSPVAAIVVLGALAAGVVGYVAWQLRQRGVDPRTEEEDRRGHDELAADDGRR